MFHILSYGNLSGKDLFTLTVTIETIQTDICYADMNKNTISKPNIIIQLSIM